MIVRRLSRPISSPGATLTAKTLRSSCQENKAAIADEIARTGERSRVKQAAILIARLSDLPIKTVRRLSASDAHAMASGGGVHIGQLIIQEASNAAETARQVKAELRGLLRGAHSDSMARA